MLRRSPIRVGELRPVGDASLPDRVQALSRAPSWLIVSGSCLATLAIFAACAALWSAWSGNPPRSTVSAPPPAPSPAPSPAVEAPAAVAPRAAFPSWAEVPHLSGPAGRDGSERVAAVRAQALGDRAEAPRSFLVPPPAAAGRIAILTPPSGRWPDPFGLLPLDAGRQLVEAASAVPARAPAPTRVLTGVLTGVDVSVLPPDEVPTLGPSVAVLARSATRPAARRPRPPAGLRRDEAADQTASIVGRPADARPRTGEGALARAPDRRAGPGPVPGPQAPSPVPWTLPPALAPTP